MARRLLAIILLVSAISVFQTVWYTSIIFECGSGNNDDDAERLLLQEEVKRLRSKIKDLEEEVKIRRQQQFDSQISKLNDLEEEVKKCRQQQISAFDSQNSTMAAVAKQTQNLRCDVSGGQGVPSWPGPQLLGWQRTCAIQRLDETYRTGGATGSGYTIQRLEEIDQENANFLSKVVNMAKAAVKSESATSPHLYHQEYYPLFNNVTLGDHSPEAILRIYPKLAIETCMKYAAASFLYTIQRLEFINQENVKRLSKIVEVANSISYSRTTPHPNYVQPYHPMFNNVTLGDRSPEAIQRMYPKVSIETCMKYARIGNDDAAKRKFVDTSDWFEIDRSIVMGGGDRKKNTRCLMNLSLFRKSVESPYGDVTSPKLLKRWHDKFLTPALEFFDPTHERGYSKDYPDCDFHLYLANDLQHLLPHDEEEYSNSTATINRTGIQFPKHENLTIHVMKSSSVGASPGTLWRYLGLNNPNYTIVAAGDIGKCGMKSSPAWCGFIIPSLLTFSCVFFFFMGSSDRMFHRLYYEEAERVLLSSSNGSNGYNLVTVPFGYGRSKGFINAAVILGSVVISKPIVSFDLKDVAIGFIRLVQHRLSVQSPLTFSDDEPITWWNVGTGPSPTMIHGWGTSIFGYCFDERFLKHVLYNSQNVVHLDAPVPRHYPKPNWV